MANSYGFDPVAWSIDGGKHRGELLRVLAFAATAGAEGIVTTTDCKVHQLATPGPQVEIDAGALLIRNRSANVRNQTYIANGRTPTRLDVTQTGGSSRQDLVIVRIEDPQYGSGFTKPPVGQEADWQYVKPFIIQGVPAGTTSAAALNLGYPAVALARLEIPAGTSVITNAMVKDLRQVAQPRRQRFVKSWRMPDGTAAKLDAAGPMTLFPSMQLPVYCPEWASQVKMIVNVGNMAQGGQKITGGMRAEYGWNLPGNPYVFTEVSGIHYVVPPDISWSISRNTTVIAGECALPANFRGKTHYVRIGTQINGGIEGGGSIAVDEWTTITVDMEFVEVAE